jgi:hypothetical protein
MIVSTLEGAMLVSLPRNDTARFESIARALLDQLAPAPAPRAAARRAARSKTTASPGSRRRRVEEP